MFYAFGSMTSLILRKKCPDTEFFLVRISLYSDKKKLRIWTHFTQCYAEFKTLELYNFAKSDQSATKFCAKLFLHTTNKKLT